MPEPIYKRERLRHKLTIRDVAVALSVLETTVQQWEDGLSEPMAGNLIKLAKLYDCTPEYLLGYANQKADEAVAWPSTARAL